MGSDARLAARPPLDAESEPRFVQIDQHARAFGGDGAQGIADQPPATAVGGVEHVAEHAARMDTHQHPFPAGHLAPHQSHVVLGIEMAGVNDGLNAPFALDLQSGRPARVSDIEVGSALRTRTLGFRPFRGAIASPSILVSCTRPAMA